jgi:hypothetical protein
MISQGLDILLKKNKVSTGAKSVDAKRFQQTGSSEFNLRLA